MTFWGSAAHKARRTTSGPLSSIDRGVRARPAVRAVVAAMLLCLGPAARPLAAPFFAAPAPAGTPRGDGTRDRPWDLATALSGGRGRVQPGDTIWLRGGPYTGNFDGTLPGTSEARIVVRQYPGERATMDGKLHVHGAYAIYDRKRTRLNSSHRCISYA